MATRQKAGKRRMAIDTDRPITFARKEGEKPAREEGEMLLMILNRDRHIPAGTFEVWRAQYYTMDLPGWQGASVYVAANICRDASNHTIVFNLVAPIYAATVPGLWSPFDALAWFALGAEDRPIWHRDPEEEARMREGERRTKNGVIVPGGPVARWQQHD